MSTEALTIEPLGTDIRRNLPRLKESARVIAGTLGVAWNPEGLNAYHVTLTDAEYDALGKVQVDANDVPVLDAAGETIPLPRRVPMAKPARLHGAPNHGALQNYREDSAEYIGVAEARNTLRTMVLIGCGPTIMEELSTDVGGLAAKTLAQIWAYLERQYGTLKADDVAALRDEIVQHPFANSATFSEDATKFLMKIAILNRGGENMSNTQLIEIFTNQTDGVPGIRDITLRYKRRVPELVDRNLRDLIERIRIELPTITTSAARYVNHARTNHDDNNAGHDILSNAAQANGQFAAALQKIGDRLDSMESKIQQSRNGKTPNQGRGGGRAGGGRGGAAGRGAGAPQSKYFCFEHGTNRTHNGKECKVMINDSTYTQAMKDAASPCTIDGVTSNN